MAVRKITNSWWVDFRHGDVRFRKRSPANSKAGAEAYEAVLRQKLARGEEIISSTQINKQKEQEQVFEKFAWTWFNSYVRANNKRSEVESKRYILRAHLIPFFRNIPVGKIDTMKVELFKAKKIDEGLSNKSINNYLTVFNTCLRAAQDWLSLPSIPKIKLLKTPSSKTEFLTEEECDSLLANISGMPREIIYTALKTGLRKGELKALNWQDIDWLNKRIVVKHSWCRYTKELTTPKSNKVRYVPLMEELYLMLKRRKQASGSVFYTNEKNENFDYWTLKCQLKKACEKAKLRPITVHELRHSFASHLVMRGAPLAAVQELLGHSDIRTTMRYAHLAQSSLREAIRLLEPMRLDFGQQVVNSEKQSINVTTNQKTSYLQ